MSRSSRDRIRKYLHGPVAIGLLTLLVQQGLLVQWTAARDLAVGDKVKFEFMGDDHEGVVTGFTGTGWPRVKFKYRGREEEQFFPTN